jgi:Sulfotransferase family
VKTSGAAAMSDQTAMSGQPPVPDQRYAFVLGTGRCGSTLVHELLTRHPDVGFVTNVDDRTGRAIGGRLQAGLYRRLPAAATRKGRVRLAPSEAYRALGREVSGIVTEPARDLEASDAVPWLASRFEAFFASRATAFGAPLFLHKFTGWPRAGLLHAVFPEARFVHVVRDGRAVACSLVQQPWWDGFRGPGGWSFGPLSGSDDALWQESGRSFTVLAGLEWKLLMQAFAEAQALMPAESWLELRYEDIVERPREQVQRLLDHLGLEWTASFERSFAALEFAPDRAGAYRDELSARDAAMLDRALAPALRDHGYPVGE